MRMQNLVDLLLGLLINTLLLGAVTERSHDVLHGGKFIVTLSLGTQADLIAMVLDLRLVP